MRLVYWIALALMTSLYAAMLFWTLPHLSAVSGGALMFDLRPTGYDFDEARDLLTALGDHGRYYYLNMQQKLDTAFPALLAIVLIMSYLRLFNRAWAIGFSVLAVAAMVFDYLENTSVSVMLQLGAEGISESMVETASGWTQLKSITVTIALTLLIVGLVLAFMRRRRA